MDEGVCESAGESGLDRLRCLQKRIGVPQRSHPHLQSIDRNLLTPKQRNNSSYTEREFLLLFQPSPDTSFHKRHFYIYTSSSRLFSPCTMCAWAQYFTCRSNKTKTNFFHFHYDFHNLISARCFHFLSNTARLFIYISSCTVYFRHGQERINLITCL